MSATRCVGDGSGLTGISANTGRITSATASAIANNTSVSLDLSGSVNVSRSIRLTANGSETCDAGHMELIRVDPVTHIMEICY